MAIAEAKVAILCLCAFGVGVFVGYRLKTTRMKYLQWRKDRLKDKLYDIKRRINDELNG